MSTRSDAERRLRAANMLPPTSDKPEAAWSSSALLERIEEKAAGVETKKRPAPRPAPNLGRPRRRARLVAAVALAILVPALLLTVFFSSSTDENDVATTPPPTTPVQPIETDASDVPFYARINADEIFHDEDWAVIVFYRSPNCIPPNVNLLDIPDGTAVSDCGPSTVEGVSTWESGPDIDAAPLATEFTGLGEVPVWFVPWPLLERVTADGVLTRIELLAMRTKVEGTASIYQERSGQDMLELAGSGELAEGEQFSFSVSGPDVSLSLPFAVGPVMSGDLVGAWESRDLRVEFDPDGTFRIIVTGTRGFINAEPPPPGDVGEGTFDISSGVLTFSLTFSQAPDRPHFLCIASDPTGTYFAGIGEDGLLAFDIIADPCGLLEAQPPFERIE